MKVARCVLGRGGRSNSVLLFDNGVHILTDDGDFATVPGITVFTANRTIIDAARDCGKLKMR